MLDDHPEPVPLLPLAEAAVAEYDNPLLRRLAQALLADFADELHLAVGVACRRSKNQSIEEIAAGLDITVPQVRAAVARLERLAASRASRPG